MKTNVYSIQFKIKHYEIKDYISEISFYAIFTQPQSRNDSNLTL